MRRYGNYHGGYEEDYDMGNYSRRGVPGTGRGRSYSRRGVPGTGRGIWQEN